MPSKITEEQIKSIVELRTQGRSILWIAKTTGIGMTCVKKYVKPLSKFPQNRVKPRRLSKEQKVMAIALRLEGKKVNEIAAIVNGDYYAVYAHLKRKMPTNT